MPRGSRSRSCGGGTSTYRANDLTDTGKSDSRNDDGAPRDQAKTFLETLLADGPVPAKEVKKACPQGRHLVSHSSAETLDWICQVAGKRWADDILARLVRALDDVLRPQARLCSFGRRREAHRREGPRARHGGGGPMNTPYGTAATNLTDRPRTVGPRPAPARPLTPAPVAPRDARLPVPRRPRRSRPEPSPRRRVRGRA